MADAQDPLRTEVREWTEVHIHALVERAVAEGREIDFKRELPGRTDKDRRKLAADLTSFANAAGGWLVFGIEESDGIAAKVTPVADPSSDETVQWLDQVAQALVSPRIPGLAIVPIQTAGGGYCVVVRVPMSWMKPHAVVINDALRFYARNSAGKYLLDVQEVRDLFVGSELGSERLRAFRNDRIMRVEGGDTPMRLVGKPKLVLHLVPLSTFLSGGGVEVREFQWKSRVGQLQTIAGGFDGWRYNLDGIVTYLLERDGAMSYVQVFRNGVIEAVDTYSIVGRLDSNDVIPTKTFEDKLVASLPPLFAAQRFLELDPPIVVMLSLVGVKGLRMGLKGGISDPIEQDVLLFPELIAESYPEEAARFIHPVVDMVWNAWGFEHSPNFDIEGNYFG